MTLTVVYIVGARNCGSTMLDALLGAAPGARSLGEVGGFQRCEPDRACACLRPQQACAPCRSAFDAIQANGSFAAYRQRANAPLRSAASSGPCSAPEAAARTRSDADRIL